jgi:hypothetical protein
MAPLRHYAVIMSLIPLGPLGTLAACGGADDAPAIDAPLGLDGDGDGPTPIDGPEAVCTDPDTCPWIEEYLTDVVARLSGEQPIDGAGTMITRRASSAQRAVARQFLVDELTARGFTPTLHAYDGANGANVVVHLPSTTGRTGPRMIIGAHFDGVPAGPAAADNATGTAVVLVAARYLAGLPRRDLPIDLVLFDQEEVGLVGSGTYAAKLDTEKVAVDSVHNTDMVSFDGDGDGLIELWSPHPTLEALYRQHAEPRGIPISAVTFDRSDHQSFIDRGFVATGVGEEFFGNDHSPHYHLVSDTFDKVNFTYLTAATRMLLAVYEDRAIE